MFRLSPRQTLFRSRYERFRGKFSNFAAKQPLTMEVHPTMRVGSAILKHVSLIIDAPRKQFVFVPHNGQEITVGNSEAGSVSFIPSEVGNTLGVLKAVVRKGSTAYQKGIRTGDYLIEVNGIPIKDICTYMLMERKDEEALFKFRSPDGIEKVVKLKRTN